MAYATHSTEAQVERFLREEDTTVMFLATLAELRGIRGASQSRLSSMQRGKALNHDTGVELGALITKLKALRDRAKPIPIRFQDAQVIDALLRAMETDSLVVVVFESSPASPEPEVQQYK